MIKTYERILNKMIDFRKEIDDMPEFLKEPFKDRYNWHALGMISIAYTSELINNQEYAELEEYRKSFFAK